MTQPLFLVLKDGTQVLSQAGIDNAPRDARLLLAEAVGLAPDRMTLERDRQVTESQKQKFERLIAQRVARQPVSQILGRKAFWGRMFQVTPDVLTPRPETEFLIEAALSEPFERVLDLGTGSGAIAITLLAERPEALGVATDLSEAAVQVAANNRDQFSVASRLHIRRSDWFENVTGRFDLIVSNPPYITEGEMAGLAPEVGHWEPEMALTPGGDGLAAYREIISSADEFLSTPGRIIFEIGHEQGAAVCDLLQHAGFHDVVVIQDLDGKDRIVQARWG